MKLIRFGEINKEKPGICIDGSYYDVSGFISDYDELFFGNGGIPHLEWMIKEHNTMLASLPQDIRLGSPVARPSKLICIGLNYADHAKETKATPPTEPVIFMKATTAIVGPYDEV